MSLISVSVVSQQHVVFTACCGGRFNFTALFEATSKMYTSYRGMIESPGRAYGYECSTAAGLFVSRRYIRRTPRSSILYVAIRRESGDQTSTGRWSRFCTVTVTCWQQPVGFAYPK